MTVSELDMFRDQQRSNWVRLRTLVILRWVAIAGQIAAILFAVRVLRLEFEVGLAAMTIGASVVGNLFSSFLYPGNKRLSEREAALMLVFDILQLSLLLYLTGGLNNPFALLILAPVTIAATVLDLRTTALVGVMAIALTSALGQWYLPLVTEGGMPLMLPALFRFGFWVALVIGIVFIGIYARQVTTEMHTMGEALRATQLALAREQKLTDLGGVVAAAAHELGTPLATIKLVSSELLDDLQDPDLIEDVQLIRQQADRCRDILRSMGRAGKEDMHLRQAPVEAVVREAAEPHMGRGKSIVFAFEPADPTHPARQPVILRRPEIVHGLRNLIQNAVDFAAATVEVEATWSETAVTVRIEDDGAGFPQSVIGRIGDPFMRRRRVAEDRSSRPGYEGMGLGLFIAKTLLERSGARLSFANGGAARGGANPSGGGGGAIVVVEWRREALAPTPAAGAEGLGENLPILP